MIDINTIPFTDFDAVVLDLDGTLYQKPHMVWHMMVGDRCHLLELAGERIARTWIAGRHYESQDAFYQSFFWKIAQWFPFSAKHAQNWYFTHYLPTMLKVIQRYYRLSDWVQPLVEKAKAAGAKVVVYSDYEMMAEKFAILGFDASQLDYAVCASELGGVKPCKESMQALLKMLKVTASRTLVIGDRDKTDGEAARRVGARFICCK